MLADNSGRYTPNDWAQRAKQLKREFHADCYVADVNQGGNLVVDTLRTTDPNAKVISVHASQGKTTRAEPVAALYEQRRMHHVDPHGDMFRVLEAQMCEYMPGATRSPDRMDALVWGVYELFLKDDVPDYSMFTERVNAFQGMPPFRRAPWEW